MMKLAMVNRRTGAATVIIGLSDENLFRLVAKQPALVDVDEILAGVDPKPRIDQILVFTESTEEAMVEVLRERGLIDDMEAAAALRGEIVRPASPDPSE